MSENLERNPLSAEFLLAEFNALQERAISLGPMQKVKYP